MKKSLGVFAISTLLLTSCQSIMKTSRTADFSSSIENITVADLDVSENRITYTMSPKRSVRRGGLENVKSTAEQEALKEHGGGDVLLDPLYVISKRKGLLGSKVTSITVSGRPASYVNYRTLNDSVWVKANYRARRWGATAGNQSSADKDFLSDDVRPTGFTRHLTLTGMHGKCVVDWDGDTHETFAANALLSLGRQFTPRLYVGAGAGAVYLDDAEAGFVPIFGNARVYLSEKRKSFFCDLKVGYSPVTFGDAETEGGMFAALALGYSFGKVDVALQSMRQNFSVEDDYSGFSLKAKGIIGLSVGFKF